MSNESPNYDSHAERSIAGSVLCEPETLADFLNEASTEDVYELRPRLILEAAVSLVDEGKPVDCLTVCDLLESNGHIDKVGGRDKVMDLAESVVTVAHVAAHAKIVREEAVRRKITYLCHEVAKKAQVESENPDVLLDILVSQIDTMGATRNCSVTAKDASAKMIRAFESGVEVNPVIPTHLSSLNENLGGFGRGEMIVVAGRPSMGKTALAMNFVDHISVNRGLPSIVFSLETEADQLFRNLVTSRAQVNQRRFVNGRPQQGDEERVYAAAAQIGNADIVVHDNPAITLTGIRMVSTRLARQFGQLGLIVVDYLQLMTGTKAENRQQEVATLSRGLKVLARQLDVPVIAVCQLSRAVEFRNPPRPRLSDLRESGAIEQDADKVLLVYREDYYEEKDDNRGRAELIVAKNRIGETGATYAMFIREQMRFADIETNYGNPL